MIDSMKRFPMLASSLLFVLLGFGVLLAGCRAETVATTAPVPTIEELPLVAIDVPITTLLRYPYDFEGEHVRITGQYKPLPLMACMNDAHTSPATWMLSDEGIEVPAAGFDDVLRELGQSDISLVVEGRWQFWDGPVGCGRRAPEEEVWHLQVSRIVSPNPLSQLASIDQEIASGPLSTPTEEPTPSTVADTSLESGTPIPVIRTATVSALPLDTPTPMLLATPTPIPSTTPRNTNTVVPTGTIPATSTRPVLPTSTQIEGATSSPTSIATATETPAPLTATNTPSPTPLPTQIGPTGGDTLLFERISRSELGVEGVHAWEFEALVDDTISISAGPATDLNIALELVDPNGTTLAVTNDFSAGQGETINELILETGGEYQVEVRAVGGTSGDYSIVLTNLESEAFLIFKDHLSYGGLGTGNLPANTDHLWNFHAAAGDMVTARVDPANADDLVLFLVGPDSTELIFVDDGGLGDGEQITDYVITEAGVYSLRVGELEFQPAGYTVTLAGP